jgi:hypothetical protein
MSAITITLFFLIRARHSFGFLIMLGEWSSAAKQTTG